jgi:hypothetical protein
MAKEGAGKCLHDQIGGKGERLRAYGQREAYMAKVGCLHGHPYTLCPTGAYLAKRWGGERFPLWPSPPMGAYLAKREGGPAPYGQREVPIWPKEL